MRNLIIAIGVMAILSSDGRSMYRSKEYRGPLDGPYKRADKRPRYGKSLQKHVDELEKTNKVLTKRVGAIEKKCTSLEQTVALLHQHVLNLDEQYNTLVQAVHRSVEPEKEQAGSKKPAHTDTVILKVADRAIYGVRLGAPVKELRRQRLISGPGETAKKNNGQARWSDKGWQLKADDPAVKEAFVFSFKNRIYAVSIAFQDTSESNYEVIKKELDKKYGPVIPGSVNELFGEAYYRAQFGRANIIIQVNRDMGILEPARLVLTYVHEPLMTELSQAAEAEKALKIKNKL